MNDSAFQLGEQIKLRTVEYKLHSDLWNKFNFPNLDLKFENWVKIKYLNANADALEAGIENIPNDKGGLYMFYIKCEIISGYPNWQEIEFKYDETETYQMGLLDFPSQHKIFPVDGQHRVEGIKAALKDNPELKDQHIAALFIGHKNDDAGKQRTRRLFTTLNRYAKPVLLDDIIALDEDDTVAITTRYLLEEYDLFTGKRVIYAKQKAIPTTNKEAITSIITLYQANLELFKIFYGDKFNKKPTQKVLGEYLKFRPSNENIEAFREFCVSYWDAFKTRLSFIAEYVNTVENAAEAYRNNETGGNLLFRPIGLLPFVKSSLLIYQREEKTFDQIFERFNEVNFDINSRPWLNVVWNQIEKKMIMNSDSLTQLLLVYLYEENILTEKELKKLKEGYASKISAQDVENALEGF